MKIDTPKNTDYKSSIEFAKTLFQSVREPEPIEIDFGTNKFATPFGTCLIAESIKEFVRIRKNDSRKTSAMGYTHESKACSYLSHIGFFKYIGIDIGKEPDEAPGSKNYVPIREITRKELKPENSPIARSISKYCADLARVLYSKETEYCMAKVLSYCFQEIVRNSFEHGEVDKCVAFAQRWENKNRAQVAIIDKGIGIYKSLRQAYTLDNEASSLEFSIKPGITRNKNLKIEEEWENTGFGLFVLSEMGKTFGAFYIASSKYSMLLTKNSRKEITRIPIGGTFVGVDIDLDEADYFPNWLENTVRQGEKFAAKDLNAKKTASKMSKTASMW